MKRSAARQQNALTLLEVILALALSVFVLAAIAWAIQLHLRALDTRRGDVEEAQLARAVLKLIADDLHSVVAYNTIDFSEAAQLAALDIPGLAEGDLEEGDENFEQDPGAGSAGNTAGDAADGEGEDEPKDISDDLTPGDIPGIYGNQYQLQLDISRLPRIEDFDPALQPDDGEVRDLPSDVKTVAYYLQPDTAVAAPDDRRLFPQAADAPASSASPGQGWGRGLVRRALDRAATQWAYQNGDLSRLDATGEVIAPEVVALEFRYFDGQQWLPTWDTEQSAGLPMAVEVAIAITADDGNSGRSERSRPRSSDSGPAPSADGALGAATSDRNMRIYHQVIRIPSAQPTFDEEEALETDVE